MILNYVALLFISAIISLIIYIAFGYFESEHHSGEKNLFLICLIVIFCVLFIIYNRNTRMHREIDEIITKANTVEEIQDKTGKYFDYLYDE